MAGQISLCQATFAATGAFTVGQLVHNQNMSVLLALVLGMLLSAAVGAIVAIPALRLAGIYVALATLAFALLFDNVLAPLSWVGHGSTPLTVARPVIGPFDFGYPLHDRSYFVLCLLFLGIAGGAVLLISKGTTGRYLNAIRGSERAASSIGINPVRAKITAFAVSGALAGLGGGLLASYRTAANPTDFVYLLGLFWVLIVVTIGSQSVFGAIAAGFSFALVPEIINSLGISNQLLWSEVLFGLGIITYVKYPEGIIEAQTRGAIRGVARLLGMGDHDRGEVRGALASTEEAS
jgi:ABC-type branched-subunit amino acid transport system permease subunit